MANEQGNGSDAFGIEVLTGIQETGGHCTVFAVDKWDDDQIRWVLSRDYDGPRLIGPGAEPAVADFRRLGVSPFERYELVDANLITDVGWQNIMGGIAGTTPTKFANGTTGRIGLGTSATAAAYTDTALGAIGALTTANWKVINAVPVVGATHTAGLVLAAQFATAEANGVAIAEFGVDYGTASTLSAAAVGGLFSHGNATPGTKTSAQTWNATVTYTWS